LHQKTQIKLSKEKFLSHCEQMYDKMVLALDSNSQDFYSYESKFDELQQFIIVREPKKPF
jgi:hypothetical protein